MSVLGYIKNFIPLNVMFKVKYYKELHNQKTIKLEERKHIFFLDAPDYGNIGDQAIAYAIYQFANKYFSEYQFIEVLQKDVASYLKFLKKNIQDGDIIFLTGGGNMGNYYRIYEATRRIVINSFRNNKIVVFPQSIMYSDDIFGKISLFQAKRIYNRHPSLVICAREHKSFEKMNKVFDSVLLCPDIVLSLVNEELCVKRTERKAIGICLRDDIEQNLTEEDRLRIRTEISKVCQDVRSLSTVGECSHIDFSTRKKIVLDKINQIAQCRVLVTDRLHAMIFAIISRTPCVVFNNSNSKIAGTIEWLGDYNGVRLINPNDNIIESLSNMMSIDKLEDITLSYKSLIEKIGM